MSGLGLRSVRVDGLAVTGLTSGWSSHLLMKEIIPLCLVQPTHKLFPRVESMVQPNRLNSVQKHVYTQQNPQGWWLGVWEGLGMDKHMGFVMFVASSKYGNAYPAFHKEYGFPYHLTPKILKEIIAAFLNRPSK